MEKRIEGLAYCGLFCGACPSFEKSCFGCRSDDRDQARVSKWKCRIRVCATEEKRLLTCLACEEFPCKEINRKLINSHPGDPRFTYRHELLENRKKLEELGPEAYLDYQAQKWSCPQCGGRVSFYTYTCKECGFKTAG